MKGILPVFFLGLAVIGVFSIAYSVLNPDDPGSPKLLIAGVILLVVFSLFLLLVRIFNKMQAEIEEEMKKAYEEERKVYMKKRGYGKDNGVLLVKAENK